MRRVWRDWILATVCALAQLSSAQPGDAEPRGSAAGAVALVAGLIGGLVLVWRRRVPLGVLAAATAAYVVQAAAIGPIVPVAVLVGCYASARWGSTVRGAVAGLLAVAVVAVTVLVVGPAGLAPTYAVPLVLAVLAAVLVAAREARVEAMTQSAVLEERLRIARDLHDVVGHGMSAITVQAGAGRTALAAGADDEARRALITIEEAGRGVLREVRWLVGVLRELSDDVTSRDVVLLVEAARRAGFDMDLSIEGDVESVPPEIAEAAYRIVQEGLTNAFRHSGSERVRVQVEVGDLVVLTLVDDGGGAPAAEGHGIRGMRERAAAVGGDLYAGPRADASGWEVRATLPIGGGRR
jgi:signal transduction histidine kinase